MDFIVIGLVAFVASGLTLYSGFGLGTVLLPAFALFFPAPAAVAATGVVHLLSNLFKGGLVGREAHWPTVLRFGLPAVPGAIAGAFMLAMLSEAPAFHRSRSFPGKSKSNPRAWDNFLSVKASGRIPLSACFQRAGSAARRRAAENRAMP